MSKFPSNNSSAQPCGCDAGANHLCERHTEKIELAVEHFMANTTQANADEYEKAMDIAAAEWGCEAGLMPVSIGAWTPTNIGIAPPRPTALPTAATERKQHPVASGVLDYFPKALAAVAHVSYVGNEQHNPGQPLHWDRSKSADEADALIRHFLERGTLDKDGLRHSAKVAWRALALLEKELENA